MLNKTSTRCLERSPQDSYVRLVITRLPSLTLRLQISIGCQMEKRQRMLTIILAYTFRTSKR